MPYSFFYFTAYIITSYHDLVLLTSESATYLKTALQELLCLYCSMYNQYKHCHLQQMESAVSKLWIGKRLLLWVYLKEPLRKIWIKIQLKLHKKNLVTNRTVVTSAFHDLI